MNRAARVLFFQRCLPPEPSAVGALVADLGEELVRRGWEVKVVGTRTSKQTPRREVVNGVTYLRELVREVDRRSLVSRAAVLPATWSAMLRALGGSGRTDILVTLTDPPLAVCAGAFFARHCGCRHVHWCQDLYPEVAAAAGVIADDGVVFRLLRALTRAALRRCDRVVAVGRCMQDRLGEIPSERITNWGRVETTARPTPDGFRILYSGNLGRAHDFEGLQSAAALTQGEGIRWIVCGSGPQADVPRSPVERRAPVTWAKFPDLLASASAHLITLRDEFCGLVVPSKLYDCAASGRPLIFAGPVQSECARAILEEGMGIVVPDRDGEALAAAARRLAGDAGLVRQMSRAAMAFGARHRLGAAAEVFERLLNGVLTR